MHTRTKPNRTEIGGAGLVLDCTTELRLEGRMTGSDVDGRLGNYLDRLHRQLAEATVRRLIVDVTDLTWASESAVSAIVAWILAIEQEQPERHYAVRFRIDGRSAWQTATFEALQEVAANVVEIEHATSLRQGD